MPAVIVMQSMALGVVATTKRKTCFPTGVTDSPQKGEADNSRHGFLCLYQPLIEATNYGLTPQLTSRNQQQLLQSCQRCVPTASYNILTHSKIGLPPLGEGQGRGFCYRLFFHYFNIFYRFPFGYCIFFVILVR